MFLKGGILEDSARVGGGFSKDFEGYVAAFGRGVTVHGYFR